MGKNYSNVAVQTTLSSGVTSGAASLTVAATTGFPSPDFTLVLDPGTVSEELVLVTGVGGTTLTVTRGYDGTTAVAHDAGAVVRHVHSAKDFKDSRDHEAATADVHGVIGPLATPSGVVAQFAGSAAPTGWLLADGSAVSRTTYAALFSVIGTTYGAGDGSSTFNVPNFKGRVPVGRDSSQGEFDTLGETGGAKTHTLTEGELPSHGHTYNQEAGASIGYAAGASSALVISSVGSSTTGAVGGGGAHNNLQPYIVLNYIIKH